MKLANLFLVVLFSISLVSCDTEEIQSPLNISTTVVEMEGEGGQQEIHVTGDEWKIIEVVSLNENWNLFGSIYSIDGNRIRNNSPLALDGLGRMETGWSNKGFSIIRRTATSLEIVLKENSTGADFNFVIMLESGGRLQEITVKQKKSQGYQFEKIEYALKENDGDSLFTKKGNAYEFNLQSTSLEFSFSPINGIDIERRSFFESPEDDAFVWIKSDSIEVDLPSAIHDNEIYYNGEKSLYTDHIVKREHNFKELKETITLPSGESKFFTELEYRKRVISYTLHLTNNRTNEKKTIEGKWIEYAPTGNYSVEWE